ncbi:cap-specific mRNA (nucleoside-2'-O-)-methyltransferase 1 [Octopus bimaculoides]|uniref:Cap-specific mRNA (nucleoside-2'-O-)-methyltransferase 1 n=1 Tax=Octopus bimaculoides TaxID=37653 RepID=A0A0L8GFK4_OCTBM|nr:cap-specific mRNA (nucleoside-2'-O-)-methyltransferase 1 [Octopus bimaculoides]|eukprot:XP_014781496.1 PREDICTED: cap-specific mRNA (nucleoside-2'-O-)-methyltransferase 1-like isoform X1 [Octopus bimaculoides]
MSFEKVERLSDSESDADQFNLGAGHDSSALSDSNDEGRGDSYVPFFSQKRTLETSDDEGANRPTKVPRGPRTKPSSLANNAGKKQNRNLSYSQMSASDSYEGFKKHGILDLNSEVKDSESDADQFNLGAGHDSSALSDSNDEGRGDSYVPFFSEKRTLETSDDEGANRPTKVPRAPRTKPSSLTDNTGKKQNRNLSYSQMNSYGGFKKHGILDLNSEVKDSDSEPEPQALLSGHESTTFSDSNDEGKPELFSGSFSAKQSEDSQKEQTANQFQHAQNASYSETSLKIMAKMGYQDGKGLGKNAQGRVEIVEASKQRGRRGFGLYPKAFLKTEMKWDPNEEEISVIETVDWMKPCTDPMPLLEELRTWKATGKKKTIIDDELNFVSSELLSGILDSKNIFDELESEEMRKARSRSNPYETIRGVIFQNRAAMKMSNIDAVCDFMLTQPKSKTGQPLVSSNSLLYFADICAGPGGFSEYVLWRRKGDAKGFGLTLRECNDFKLEEFFAGPSEMFEPHYGADGTGDIYKTENQKAFEKFVKENTESKGVHFVMADGGFSVEGQENIQEILSKQLYLCQFLTALLVLRDDGHFVCKLFDIFTPFSVGLVYLMYRAFHQIAIFKPVTSRPANSERYIICKALRTDAEPIKQYLHEINLELLQMDDDECDINDIVPLETLLDGRFYEYIRSSNDLLAKKQINNLRKIHSFALDTNRHEYSQKDIRKQCLQLWKIPDNVRVAPAKGNPSIIFSKLMEEDCNMYHLTYEDLTPAKLKTVKSLYDYRCFVTGSENRYFILGLGRGHVCFWNGNQSSNWCKIEDKQIHIELPSETLLEAEIVQEFQGEGKGQKKQMTVHVLDAYFLCGDNVQKLHFNERIERLKKFVKAITKTTRSDLAPISVPEIYRMEEIHKIFDRLEMKLVKGQSRFRRLCYCKEKKHYFLPSGVHFVKITKDPWTMCLSKSSNTKYFFDTSSGVSTYVFPADAITNTRDCRINGIRWKWQEGVRVHDSQPTTQDRDKFSKEDILQFIQDKINK